MQDFLAAISLEIQQLENWEFWLGAAVAIAISLFLFWRMACWYQHARLIQNIPTARIRSAPQGYIELIGQAGMMEGLVIFSPLSQTDNYCAPLAKPLLMAQTGLHAVSANPF